jgi:hypothetical protein
MSKHRSTQLSEPITGIAEATAERMRLGLEILQALAHAVATIEETQQRFRTAVFIRLSRIETMVQMIQAGQIVGAHLSEPGSDKKIRNHAENAQEYVSRHSHELGLKMVKYVCGGLEALDPQPKARRKRPGGLSYEI